MTRGPVVAVTQRVEVLADRDERRDALDQAWTPRLEPLGATVVPVPNALADPPAWLGRTGADLLVLSGGNDLAHLPGAAAAAPERDATEAALLDHAARTGLPVLGVCRGLQLMVVRAGGTLVRREGHVARTHDLDVVPAPRWPVRAGPVNSFHDWGVDVPGRLEVLARAPDGSVEAVADAVLPQVGIMWHPERAPFDDLDLDLVAALVAAR